MKNTVYPKLNLSTALVLRAECRAYPMSSNDLCHLHLSLSLLASIRQAEMCSNVNNCLYPSFLHASTIMLQTSKYQKKKKSISCLAFNSSNISMAKKCLS